MLQRNCSQTRSLVLYTLLTLGILVVAGTAGLAAPPATFAPAVVIPGIGPGVFSIAAGDFNNDARLDLVTANSETNTVSVVLNNGDGTFQPPVNYTVDAFPYSVVVGDFNGDGNLDLAVANGQTVGILLGNGDGTFQPVASIAIDAAFSNPGMAVGNFNGDKELDLALSRSPVLSLLPGQDDGAFGAPVNSTFGGSRQLVAGDFNGDGNLDLAAPGAHSVVVLLGNGNGTFRPAISSATIDNVFSLAAGDFNGDGKLDVVTVSGDGANRVLVLPGNGDGSFQPGVPFMAGVEPSGVAVGDFNGDGNPDVVAANLYSFFLSVLSGHGDGSFDPAINVGTGMGAAIMVVAGDFNGDGKPDLAAVGYHSLSILLNTTPDVTPPEIHSATASPDVLWPPNHRLIPVDVKVTATDNFDPAPRSRIIGVTSNEPVVGHGSRNTLPDWVITGDLTLLLRAERSTGPHDRIYTLTIECADASGNTSRSLVDVTVPHFQAGK